MPVTVDWYDDTKTIVLYSMEGRWTWDELYPEYHKAIAMEKAQPHRVDVVIDLSTTHHLPVNVLTHVRHFSDKQPENIGLSVIVTKNQFVNNLYQIGCRIHRNIQRYFAVTRTMEEALAMISEQRMEVEPG
jgi:hypothetical protein